MTEPTLSGLFGGAVEYRDERGLFHRDGGPARVWANGAECWYRHGRFHRADGPARVYPDSPGEWWVYGVRREDLEELMAAPVPSTRHEFPNGTVEYRDADDRLHRDDGPARVWFDGSEYWFRHGVPHRSDGPAVTSPDGYEAWYLHGQRHRSDGPARTSPDGGAEWWINGARRTDIEQAVADALAESDG